MAITLTSPYDTNINFDFFREDGDIIITLPENTGGAADGIVIAQFHTGADDALDDFWAEGDADSNLFDFEDYGTELPVDLVYLGLAQDFENLTTGFSFTFTLSIAAEDSEHGFDEITKTVTIIITDVDEAPVFVALGATDTAAPVEEYELSIVENAAAGTSAGTVLALDPEGTAVLYKLSDDSAGRDVFQINESTGEITLKAGASLDHETQDEYTLTIIAESTSTIGDGTAFSDTINVVIDVTDIDEPPVFVALDAVNVVDPMPITAFSVAEDATTETAIGTIKALDPEGEDVRYSIPRGSAGNDIFTIDRETGEISLKADNTLDFESANKTYTLNIQASSRAPDDIGGRSSKAEISVVITLTDVDEAPVFVHPDAESTIDPMPITTFDVNEGAAVGATIATIKALDPEGEDVRYAIERGSEHSRVFSINRNTGEISLKSGASLDFESINKTYTISGYASSAASEGFEPGSQRTDFNVVINVQDVTVITTVTIGKEDTPNIVQNTAAIGDEVGQATASGVGIMTYVLAGADANFYEIDENTGKITLKASLADLDPNTIHNITITATDAALGETSAVQAEEIKVNTTSVTGNITTYYGITKIVSAAYTVDAEGDAITLTPTAQTIHTTNGSYIVTNDNVLHYIGNAGFTGIDTFNIAVRDDDGGIGQIIVDAKVLNIFTIDPTATAVEDSSWSDPAGHFFVEGVRTLSNLPTLTIKYQVFDGDDKVNRETKIITDNQSINTLYGELVVDKNGYWEYNLDNTNAKVEALDSGDTGIEDISFGFAGRTFHDLDLTIKGKTDYVIPADATWRLFVPDDAPAEDYVFRATETISDIIHRPSNTSGSAVFIGDDSNNRFVTSNDFAVMYGLEGDDVLVSLGGGAIFDGGDDTDRINYNTNYLTNVVVDLEKSWRYDRASGEWEQGTGEDYTYGRASYDAYVYDTAGNRVVDTENNPEINHRYNYIKNVEDIYTGGHVGALTTLYGDNNANALRVGNGRSIVEGRGGSDNLQGGIGNDVLDGGTGDDFLHGSKGIDRLTGGEGNDIFYVYISPYSIKSGDHDIVTDFTAGDKIGVNVAGDDHPTEYDELLTAVNLRIAYEQFPSDDTTLDTVIYYTGPVREYNRTARKYEDVRPAEGVVVMVLEDYVTPLTITDFEIQ